MYMCALCHILAHVVHVLLHISIPVRQHNYTCIYIPWFFNYTLCVAYALCLYLLRDLPCEGKNEQCRNIGDEECYKADNQGYPWRVEPHTAGIKIYMYMYIHCTPKCTCIYMYNM